MRYVCFLDILGFKDRLKLIDHGEAVNLVNDIAAIVSSVFEYNYSDSIHCYFVSDSIIVYTNDVNLDSLKNMVCITKKLCEEVFIKCGLLIRGAIAKGDFDIEKNKKEENAEIKILVGRAYTEAYLLEGKIKMVGIVLESDVYEDLNNIELEEVLNDVLRYHNQRDNTNISVLRLFNCDFLLTGLNLKAFVELAVKSKWIPHYYNTLYYAIYNERNKKKAKQVFSDVIHCIIGDNARENYRRIDLFIKNAFDDEVEKRFQDQLLRYMRHQMFG